MADAVIEAQHVAMQAARQRQETAEFKAQYALSAGVEKPLVRRTSLRFTPVSLYRIGPHPPQQTLNATAMNVVRIIDWLKGGACGKPRRWDTLRGLLQI